MYCEVVKENKVIYKCLAQNAQQRRRNFPFTATLSHIDVVARLRLLQINLSLLFALRHFVSGKYMAKFC